VTLLEMSKLKSLQDGAKARRDTWARDSYVLIEFGNGPARISLGFQGPYEVTEEDTIASDWEFIHP
jgi:hypothetical protein